VIEHVTDAGLFLERCAMLMKPQGMMVVSTLNRTLKSFALAIVGAEYVLRWLPRGTHSWDKFVTPDELEIAMERAGLRTTDERGVAYNLLAERRPVIYVPMPQALPCGALIHFDQEKGTSHV